MFLQKLFASCECRTNSLLIKRNRNLTYEYRYVVMFINSCNCRLRSSNGLSLGEFDQWFSHVFLALFLVIFKLFYLVFYFVILHFMLWLCVIVFVGSGK